MFKFKSVLLIVLIALMGLFTIANAQVIVPEYETVYWGNGTSSSDALVTSDLTDTTATFHFMQGEEYPSRLSFMSIAIEGTNSDSSNTSFTLDMSNDGVYWSQYAVLETILSIATAAQTLTGDKPISLEPAVTAADQFPAFKYGRVRVIKLTSAANDTTTCKLQMVRQFIK